MEKIIIMIGSESVVFIYTFKNKKRDLLIYFPFLQKDDTQSE